jgi:hypothetical protein
MNLAKELDKKIEKKVEEVAELTQKLGEAKAYLQALQDTRRMLPREGEASETTPTLRPGSDIFKVREILQKEGQPLHVDELVRRLGKPVTKATKVSLSGSLGTYVRGNKIFTKTGPNTFGLVEFGVAMEDTIDEDAIPADFGVLKAE